MQTSPHLRKVGIPGAEQNVRQVRVLCELQKVN